jgi:mannitol-1-/sugar-/sorbitol-6-/2-deoxyglucose-6-phosphatase
MTEQQAPAPAIIFDMDGLLIDSEPLWRRAEVEVFARHGLSLREEQCQETTGLRIDEVVAHWRLPAEAAGAVVARVIELVAAEGVAKPFAAEAVREARRRSSRLALASSSPDALIDVTIVKLGIAGLFDVVYSATHEVYGKPHPGVYLTTAAKLGVAPTACVAIEDSLNGVLAAKAARMRCIAVPEVEDPRFVIADVVLPSLGGLFSAGAQTLSVG